MQDLQRDIPDQRLLTESEAADLMRMSVRTLQAWRSQVTGPAYVRAGRAIRYSRSDLVQWMRANRVVPASRAG